jgi:hypothetical protein
LGAPDDGAESTADVDCGAPAVTTGFARGLARFVEMVMVGSVFAVGRSPAAAGAAGEFGGVGDCARPCCGKTNIDANIHAVQRHALDTPRPQRSSSVSHPAS